MALCNIPSPENEATAQIGKTEMTCPLNGTGVWMKASGAFSVCPYNMTHKTQAFRLREADNLVLRS